MKVLFHLLLMIFCVNSHGRILTIAVEPTYPDSEVEEMLHPINIWLKQNSNYELELVLAENYFHYWKNTISFNPDLTIDSPHVAAYRIQQKQYVPLVRSENPMVFHLVMENAQSNESITEDDLFGKRIATLQHPSLPSVIFERWYEGSIVMPTKVLSFLSYEDGIDMILDTKADATIVPEHIFTLHPYLKSVKKSQPLLGMSIMASPNLDLRVINDLKKELILMQKYIELPEMLTNFVEAQSNDYTDYSDMIPQRYFELSKRF